MPIFLSPHFLCATFAGPQRLQKSPYTRVTIRPLILHDTPHLSLSYFTDKQDITKNFPLTDAHLPLNDLLAIGFANIHIRTTTEEIDARLTKKHELQLARKKIDSGPLPDHPPAPPAPVPHNRAKNLPFPDGQPNSLLSALGILDRNNHVRPTMRSKYTQINEFLKLLDHALADLPIPTDRPLALLDCGCGSAYLTLATHHFLNQSKKIPARVLGIDINESLIAKCALRAESLDSQTSSSSTQPTTANLEFLAGQIGSLQNAQADIVLALHACDTATDDAIVQAIRSNARLLMAVPCCHKNLHKSLHADALAPLHRHGILHQRLADLTTDAFRALILRILGYKTDVLEFISSEHTGRNLMIRAIKTPHPAESHFIRDYLDLKKFFHVTPYLESALGSSFTPLFEKQTSP